MVKGQTGMSLFLLDDQGEMWRGDSRRLRIAFDTPFSGGEFIEYSVKNLGFVAINVYGASCQIRLRPTFVTQKAFATLIDWLGESRIERAVLTLFDAAWRDELVQSSKAIGRLEEVVLGCSNGRHNDLLSKELPVQARESPPLIADLLASWPHLVNNYTTDVLLRLIGTAFDQRFVAVKQSPHLGKLVFHQFGESMYTQYDVWRTCAIGAPLQEQPDRTYGRWIAGAYREAASLEMPRQDAVDAIIRCPVAGGRQRFRYRRVIFPMQATGTDITFLAGSFADNAIDLRVPPR